MKDFGKWRGMLSIGGGIITSLYTSLQRDCSIVDVILLQQLLLLLPALFHPNSHQSCCTVNWYDRFLWPFHFIRKLFVFSVGHTAGTWWFFFVFLGGGYAMSKVQTRFYGFFCFRSHIPRHKDVGHNPKQQNVFKQLGKKTIVGLIPSSSWFNVESMFRRKVWFTLWKMLVTSLCSLVSLGYSTPSPDSCWEWQAHKLTINCAKNHSEYRWLWWTLKKWFIWRWIRSSVKSLTWV